MHLKNDKRHKNTHFLRDDSARVPFAVIGIFLVILSTLVSLNLNRMDMKMAKTIWRVVKTCQVYAKSYILFILDERIPAPSLRLKRLPSRRELR
ncbi:MAG: hypothetical protein WA144_01385 [Candidatus Methanoperedens sp.]